MSSLPAKGNVAEKLAAEHRFGTLLKSYNQHRAGTTGVWLMFIFGISSILLTCRLLVDPEQGIWIKIILSLIMFPFGLLLLYIGIKCLRSIMKINNELRVVKDEILSNYHTILLYERGLICNQWIENNGKWENYVTVLPWNAIGYLQSSKDTNPGGTSEHFFIKTKDGHTVDISLGGQELVTAIEHRMYASSASTT